MQDAKELLPLIGYQWQWIVIGSVLIVASIGWVVFIFWHTRHRVRKTVATIAPQKLAGVDLAKLQKKYLGLIDRIAEDAGARTITIRQAHQKLSLLVRLFAFEATGYPAQVMTLSDLENGKFPALQKTITAYYPLEFAALETQEVTVAVSLAKEMVSSWR